MAPGVKAPVEHPPSMITAHAAFNPRVTPGAFIKPRKGLPLAFTPDLTCPVQESCAGVSFTFLENSPRISSNRAKPTRLATCQWRTNPCTLIARLATTCPASLLPTICRRTASRSCMGFLRTAEPWRHQRRQRRRREHAVHRQRQLQFPRWCYFPPGLGKRRTVPLSTLKRRSGSQVPAASAAQTTAFDAELPPHRPAQAGTHLSKQPRIGTFSFGQGSIATDSTAEADFSGTSVIAYSSLQDQAGSQAFLHWPTGQRSGTKCRRCVLRIRRQPPFPRPLRHAGTYKGFALAISAGEEVLASGNDGEFYDVGLTYNQ